MNRFVRSWLPLGLILPLAFSCLDSGPEPPNFQEQLARDIEAIDAYLTANNITDVEEHESGLRYRILQADGQGSTITVDSCVTTNYKGMLMATGVKFDENTGISFPLNAVIAGWQIGIPLLQEGDSAVLYVPSVYGYGYGGYPPTIPSNANLIFGVKVLKVGQDYTAVGAKGKCD